MYVYSPYTFKRVVKLRPALGTNILIKHSENNTVVRMGVGGGEEPAT